jgi:hypothetical protein
VSPRDHPRPRRRRFTRTGGDALPGAGGLGLGDRTDDVDHVLETDVMRFLAIIAFCLLVIFIPIVKSLPDERVQDPSLTPIAVQTPSPVPPTATASPKKVIVAPVSEDPVTPIVRTQTPESTPTATPTPRQEPTGVPTPTPSEMPIISPPSTPTVRPSPPPVEARVRAPATPVADEPAPVPTEAETGQWRVKFQSDAVMTYLLRRGAIDLFIHTSGIVLSVEGKRNGGFDFERVDRLEVDLSTYQMLESSIPSEILWSFRRTLANLETPDWEFFIKLSPTINRNLQTFMATNSPGVIVISANEGVGYED